MAHGAGEGLAWLGLSSSAGLGEWLGVGGEGEGVQLSECLEGESVTTGTESEELEVAVELLPADGAVEPAGKEGGGWNWLGKMLEAKRG